MPKIEDPVERLVGIVKWYLSGFYIKPQVSDLRWINMAPHLWCLFVTVIHGCHSAIMRDRGGYERDMGGYERDA